MCMSVVNKLYRSQVDGSGHLGKAAVSALVASSAAAVAARALLRPTSRGSKSVR